MQNLVDIWRKGNCLEISPNFLIGGKIKLIVQTKVRFEDKEKLFEILNK